MTPDVAKIKTAYLDALQERVLVFDGAMATNLQALLLTTSDCDMVEMVSPYESLVLSAPNLVAEVHRQFLAAGVDVLQTNTFQANRIALAKYGLAHKTDEINTIAALIARDEIDKFSHDGKQRFVAGSMGPSGVFLAGVDAVRNEQTYEDIADVYCQQARALLQGDVDLLLLETVIDLEELKTAVAGIHQAFVLESMRVPLQAQVSLDAHGKMVCGADIQAVLAVFESLPVNVIGLNCGEGPEQMRAPIAYLSEHSTKPIAAIPNAGIPQKVDGALIYPVGPEAFAETLLGYVEAFDIRAIGGCCGTRAEHIRALVDGLQRLS